MKRRAIAAAIGPVLLIGSLALVGPAAASDSGSIVVTVDVETGPEACLLLGVGSLALGSAAFGTYSGLSQPYQIESCSGETQDLLIQGTHATNAPGAATQFIWELTGSTLGGGSTSMQWVSASATLLASSRAPRSLMPRWRSFTGRASHPVARSMVSCRSPCRRRVVTVQANRHSSRCSIPRCCRAFQHQQELSRSRSSATATDLVRVRRGTTSAASRAARATRAI